MAASATYEPIATANGTGSSATVSFTSISGSYTDLIVIGSIRSTNATSIMRYRYNSATTNYSATTLYGTGSAANSLRETGATGIYGIGGSGTYVASASNTFTSFTLNVFNYANSTTYKTSLLRTGGSANPEVNVGLWRATPTAITSISLVLDFGNFTSDSTFTLYGIAAA
jgi:hypothetical protein